MSRKQLWAVHFDVALSPDGALCRASALPRFGLRSLPPSRARARSLALSLSLSLSRRLRPLLPVAVRRRLPDCSVLSRLPHPPLLSTRLRALADALPSYSALPLDYVTRVGDHLLAFDQYSEPYTSSSGFAVRTLSGGVKMVHEHEIRALAESEWHAVGAALGLPAFTSRAAAVHPGEERRASATATGTPYIRTEANGAAYDADVAAAFSALWVRSPLACASDSHPSRDAASWLPPLASECSTLLTLLLASYPLRPPSFSSLLCDNTGLRCRARRRGHFHRRCAPHPTSRERGHQAARRRRRPSLHSTLRARRGPRCSCSRSERHSDRATA